MKITDEAVQAAMDATRGRISPIMLEIALNAALPHLQPVDVAAVRELRNIWYIRDLTTSDFDKAEAMISALSAEPAQGGDER